MNCLIWLIVIIFSLLLTFFLKCHWQLLSHRLVALASHFPFADSYRRFHHELLKMLFFLILGISPFTDRKCLETGCTFCITLRYWYWWSVTPLQFLISLMLSISLPWEQTSHSIQKLCVSERYSSRGDQTISFPQIISRHGASRLGIELKGYVNVN